ncbi:hypothetical protein [Prevotella koreensis]|uniref:hypothetical protein n=1 Tax=Prevotella koreensis TaxID=2490854 RepID=UPI0028ED2CA3|nr:hypothetical protein [Prevotella koreensis]
MIISFHVLNIRSARLRQETLSKQSEERTFIAQRSSLNAHHSTLNAQRSTLRSAPTGDAFEAKRRKNVHHSTLNAHHSTLNYIFIPPSTCITWPLT